MHYHTYFLIQHWKDGSKKGKCLNARINARIPTQCQAVKVEDFSGQEGQAEQDEAEQQKTSDQEWAVFRSIGTNAEPAQLQNAAQKHDRYLYGKTE